MHGWTCLQNRFLILALATIASDWIQSQAWRACTGPCRKYQMHHVYRHHTPRLALSQSTGVEETTRTATSASRMLKGSIRLGSSKPDSIIAMFPGVGAPASSLVQLAQGWCVQQPNTQFILFEVDAFSGDRAFSAACGLIPTLFDSSCSPSNPSVNGYDPNTKFFNAAEVQSNFFGDLLLSCCNDVSHALSEVLLEFGLTDEDLVLAGFSQGASVAAYTGFMRGVAGTILMGGPGAPQLQLLPPPAKTPTKVCIVSGDSDRFAPHEKLAEAFRPYGDHVNILPGLKHQIVDDHIHLGGAFIASVLARASES